MVDVWLPYNFLKKHVDAEVLFPDTGRVTYKIKSEDVYNDFFKLI